MPMLNSTSKVYAFIDSQNLNLGIRSSGWKLDYIKFRNYLRTKYHVAKAYLFIGYIEKNSTLYTFLQEAGYILIFKPVLKINRGQKVTYKGNVDAELVLHAMIELQNYDAAVIVSGDGDFRCLIEYLDKQKKLFKVLTPNTQFSSFLKEFGHYIMPLSLIREKLELQEKKERHSRGM
jgi:uncharacterized LabA/DUF88 family protein